MEWEKTPTFQFILEHFLQLMTSCPLPYMLTNITTDWKCAAFLNSHLFMFMLVYFGGFYTNIPCLPVAFSCLLLCIFYFRAYFVFRPEAFTSSSVYLYVFLLLRLARFFFLSLLQRPSDNTGHLLSLRNAIKFFPLTKEQFCCWGHVSCQSVRCDSLLRSSD